jgi:hypothetical protein
MHFPRPNSLFGFPISVLFALGAFSDSLSGENISAVAVGGSTDMKGVPEPSLFQMAISLVGVCLLLMRRR